MTDYCLKDMNFSLAEVWLSEIWLEESQSFTERWQKGRGKEK